jgi:hypothetical protein
MSDQTSFQFQCPSCGAVLQAALGSTLTSVQCGECNDVFDVQLPGRHARAPRSGARASDHGRIPPSRHPATTDPTPTPGSLAHLTQLRNRTFSQIQSLQTKQTRSRSHVRLCGAVLRKLAR